MASSAAHTVATIDLAALPTDSPEAALRAALVGTALMDNVLAALRRLAQEHVSSQTFAASPRRALPAPGPDPAGGPPSPARSGLATRSQAARY